MTQEEKYDLFNQINQSGTKEMEDITLTTEQDELCITVMDNGGWASCHLNVTQAENLCDAIQEHIKELIRRENNKCHL